MSSHGGILIYIGGIVLTTLDPSYDFLGRFRSRSEKKQKRALNINELTAPEP